MPPLYPLRFQPIFKRYLWGGRRLESQLDKPIGPGNDYAESWEVVDRGNDQSVVAHGPLAGITLGELVTQRGKELFGRHAHHARFPLLFKFLDAHQPLSVQVHPDDTAAKLLTPPDLGKTEAWVIMAAEPGSYIYAGLKRGFDRPALERELARGTCELCLGRLEPRPGDVLFLPAGAVHALGPGLVVAEIQQSSDTTYRLFDWNRTGPDGRPRQLHIEESLAVIDFDMPPMTFSQPRATDRAHVERLVECDKFVLDRWKLDAPQTIGGDNKCHLLVMLDGALTAQGDPAGPMKKGEVSILPASIGVTTLTPAGSAILLDICLPD